MFIGKGVGIGVGKWSTYGPECVNKKTKKALKNKPVGYF